MLKCSDDCGSDIIDGALYYIYFNIVTRLPLQILNSKLLSVRAQPLVSPSNFHFEIEVAAYTSQVNPTQTWMLYGVIKRY